MNADGGWEERTGEQMKERCLGGEEVWRSEGEEEGDGGMKRVGMTKQRLWKQSG